jgi:hypothetical protein
MNKTNSAAALLNFIGGTAAIMAAAIGDRTGLGGKRKPANKPAGSKLARQLSRGKKGLTCRTGHAIPVRTAARFA